MDVANLGCVELRLGVKCTGCDALIPLNGIRKTARCPRCQEDVPLSGKLRWREVLNFQNPSTDVFSHAEEQSDGEVEEGAWQPVSLTSRRAWPACECKRRFTAAELGAALATGTATCSGCKKAIDVTPVPAYFTKELPMAIAVVGADVIADAQEDDGVARPQASRPVVLACMKCGGTLDVDGTKRLVPCSHCDVGNYLPDDLWFTLHPAPRREVWWALYDRTRVIRD